MPSKIPTHKAPAFGDPRAEYNATPQRSEANDFYNSTRWRAVSKLVRRQEPCCRLCKAEGFVTAAECVDHIVPRTERPDLAYELSNLRSLCWRCHGAVRAEQREVR